LKPGPGSGLDNPLHIRLDSRVSQGPLQWFTAFPPVLARVETRAELLDLPVDLPPLLAVTDIEGDGGALARLRVPAGDRPGRNGVYRLHNEALTGTVQFQPGDSRIVADMRLPRLALLAPSRPGAELEELTLAADIRVWSGGLYAGTGHVSVGSAQVGPLGTQTRLDGFRLSINQTPREQHLDLRLDLGADTLSLGDRSYRDLQISLAAEGLDSETLSELNEGLRALSSGAVPPAMRGLIGAALMARLLPRLAVGAPRVTIDPLRVQTPEGLASARLSLNLGSSGSIGNPKDSRFADLPTWIGMLNGGGEMELPESLALNWLGRVEATSKAPSGAAATDQANAARAGLKTWVDGGWVSVQDGRVASAFRFADGLLTVNGKTFPLIRPQSRLSIPGVIDQTQ